MNKSKVKSTEWTIIICTIILITIGLFALYSASKSSELEDFRKQIIWVIVSIPLLIICININYNFLAKISIVFYIVGIGLLVTVLLTSSINGATSWFSIGPISIQPSELAKIAFILFLAQIMSKIQTSEINKFKNIIKILAVSFVPIILIILQPDYGTAFAYIFALVAMLFVSGIDRKYIIISIILVIILVPLLYFFILPSHAKARIDVYLNPETDPRGAGYNIIQSKLAIGAGKLFGLGWRTRNANTIRISISKNNRFYIFCYRRGIWIYYMCWNSTCICCTNNQSNKYSKNSRRQNSVRI